MLRFVGTRSIDFIKDSYGICELDGDKMAFNLNKQNCKSSLKGQWLPYLDISGLLTFNGFSCLCLCVCVCVCVCLCVSACVCVYTCVSH